MKMRDTFAMVARVEVVTNSCPMAAVVRINNFCILLPQLPQLGQEKGLIVVHLLNVGEQLVLVLPQVIDQAG